MEREIKRLICAFVLAALLLTLGAGAVSNAPVERLLICAFVATVCGLAMGLLVSWLVRRS